MALTSFEKLLYANRDQPFPQDVQYQGASVADHTFLNRLAMQIKFEATDVNKEPGFV
jgi:hypothetical protein